MKLEILKVIRPLFISGQQHSTMDSEEFEMVLEGSIVTITDLKTNEVCITAVANIQQGMPFTALPLKAIPPTKKGTVAIAK